MGIYYNSEILGIRIMGSTEYGFTLLMEECIGKECWKLVEKYKNNKDVHMEGLYAFTSTLEHPSISGTQWIPLSLNNKNEILNNRNVV